MLRADALHCTSGHSFPWRDNIIDFSVASRATHLQERTTHSFGVEWNKYYPRLGWAAPESAAEIDNFLIATKAIPSFFADAIVIDAGCGNGRYIGILNKISVPPPRLIIGVDLSHSVVLAATNCAQYDNVLFIRMDVNSLPDVIKAPVDYVYSIGVLHHTPDAESAFYSLARCVKDRGFLSLFLYGRGNPILYKVNSVLRNYVLQAWPPRLVYYLCALMAIPAQLFRIKFFGPWMSDLINRCVFVSPNVHNMFDAYTAGYTSFHERQEVEQWYRNAGFDCAVEERINRTSLHCIGQRVSLLSSSLAPRES